ncbi:hypothetical protein ACFL6T_02365 [Candidatus Zixiibacteriota bacterium]
MSIFRTRIHLKALLGYRLRFALLWIRNGFRAETVLFYPEYPHNKTMLFKICRQCGFNITTNLDRSCDLAFAWENTTWRDEYPELNAIAVQQRVLNVRCRDISKSHLGEVFGRVFGYPLSIDPTTHEGNCVKKSDRNSNKSGEIVLCPIEEPEDGSVYQRLVRNDHEDGLVEEFRVPVFDGRIPMVFVKHKASEDRFRTNWLDVTVKESVDVFTDEEIGKIGEFCREYALDYGEIDILRDSEDGRIYIVDANNTPWGPPRHLSEQESRNIVHRQSDFFSRTFMGR